MENLGNRLAEYLNSKNLTADYRRLLKESLADPDVQRFLKENSDKINPDAISTSAASIYEFYNNKHHQSELTKGYAPRLVVSNHNIEVAYYPNQRTQNREKRSQYESGFVLMDMANDVRQAKLDDYNGTGREEALGKALDFIDNYLHQKSFTPGLYLAGDFGVGKTYLLGAIANELFKHDVHTTLMHFPTFAIEMKDSIGQNNVLAKVNKIKGAEILMLDDIGADTMSSWIRDEILGVILQYRMQENLPTFFSSNFSMKELEQHLSVNQRGEEEPVKAKRIMERVKYLSREVIVTGPNRRNKN
ncbi:primosomal protein DnaI [Companilactobacillus mindensis DSM 14500]|jgi:DNA replication protein|uniref:Primosomal protein DnaI n=1 Tax=Companilactobacillus mindensis DSM 14500 TaxID=1423770 RepID=A0A0R1QSL3_9LACO|nr:primosomal protein DnaI [Companilactobacillus mindensis]KRL44195.1 primosomal protein DnaI [Companilactobacillus mindensis DSM 14500]GEO78679.1 primosomal protein DnaI [Companilactobacillus mindensis]